MEDWVSLEEVYNAYVDCRHRKRSSKSCSDFEINEVSNIYNLYKELNNGTYTIGQSITFCVTRPKVREVFAADFRDRIVHHLLINKTGHLFEQYFIDNTFNCRKGKGTYAGHLKAFELALLYKDGWVLQCDIKSFFMSIPKQELANRLTKFLQANYNEADKELVIKLTTQVVLHTPQNHCKMQGDTKLWDTLPKDKSLFTCDLSLGMAIGNLTSLIYANFYLTEFDHWMDSNPLIGYCRYVDDFRVFAHDKQVILKLIPEIREYLKTKDRLLLHPKKIEIQTTYKGFPFIGALIKPNRMYIGNRTVGNCYNMVRPYNYLSPEEMEQCAERFIQRYNSYMGFMKHYCTYNIRLKVQDILKDENTKFFYISDDLLVLRVQDKYRQITKLKEEYNNYGKNKRKEGHRLCLRSPILVL